MIRSLKLLGLALVAALAINAVAVGMASADVLTSEKSVTTLTGTQEGEDVFEVDGGKVTCTHVTYSGTLTASSSSSVTVTPTYTGCTFVGLAATVTMNGCDYLVTINSAVGNTTGNVDIVCPTGNEVTVTAPSIGTAKCIVHVPPQNNLTTSTGTNLTGAGTTKELTLDINITNISYSQTKGTAETGNCETKDNTTGGKYTGKALITGENSTATEHIGIFLS